MLTFELVDDDHCQGLTFEVDDVDALAEAVALVLTQEFVLARALLNGTPVAADKDILLDEDEIEDIIKRRLKPVDVTHRDGFLFQLMMWLAAHLDLADGDLIALPHSQGSAKGQDSIIVHLDQDSVVALTICEDKATKNPANVVQNKVWPEIAEYEKGGRRDELRSGVISALGTAGIPSEQAIERIRRISWAGKRRYRVRVTVQETRDRDLFKGFASKVAGPKEMRRGETVMLPEMRKWMTAFAKKVEARLRARARTE